MLVGICTPDRSGRIYAAAAEVGDWPRVDNASVGCLFLEFPVAFARSADAAAVAKGAAMGGRATLC